MSSFTFVAPFALHRCREMLQARHEPATLFAFKGQTRLAVSIAPVDPDTYRFKLRKMQKSLLSRPMGSFITASGVLQKRDDFTTFVKSDIRISTFSAALQIFLTCLIVGFFGVLIALDNPAYQTSIAAGTMGVIALLIVWLWAYIRIETQYLLKVLEAALNDAGYMQPSALVSISSFGD